MKTQDKKDKQSDQRQVMGFISTSQLKTYTPQRTDSVSASTISPYDAHVQSAQGIETSKVLVRLQSELGVTMKELATLLRVSESTIHKYKHPGESIDQGRVEQMILLVALIEHGNSIFRKAGGFQQWLRSPQYDLNNVPPFMFLTTGQGIVFVNEILGRIEHGLPA